MSFSTSASKATGQAKFPYGNIIFYIWQKSIQCIIYANIIFDIWQHSIQYYKAMARGQEIFYVLLRSRRCELGNIASFSFSPNFCFFSRWQIFLKPNKRLGGEQLTIFSMSSLATSTIVIYS